MNKKCGYTVVLFLLSLAGTLFSQQADSTVEFPTLVFKYKTDGISRVPMALGRDGTIYMSVYTLGDSAWVPNFPPPPGLGALEAISPGGSLKWRSVTDLPQLCPVVGPDGTVYQNYISDYARTSVTIVALDPEGNIEWTDHGGYLNPAIGPDGTIYYCLDKELYALNPDGSLSWKTTRAPSYNDAFQFCPSIWKFGQMFLGHTSLYSMQPDGTIQWQYRETGIHTLEPAVICPDGMALFPVQDNNMIALSKDGKLEWTYERNFVSGTDGHSAPVVAPDGTIYLNTSYEPKLQAINPDGTLKWEFEAPSRSISNLMTPVIGQDGTLYLGGTSFWHCDLIPCPKYPRPRESYFYALAPEGNLKWQYPLEYLVSAPAQLSDDGILYFPTEGGWLYALDTGTGQGLAKSGWPSRHYDAQNTANGSGVFLDFVEGGDFNNSGELSIADAVALIGFSRNYPEHPVLDLNADGKSDISDVIKLILDMRDGVE